MTKAPPLRADLLTEPLVVGRTYLVPTIHFYAWGLSAHWPVMGPRHEDAEHLDFPHIHYHIDIRFCAKRLLNAMGARGIYPNVEQTVAAQPLVDRYGPPPASHPTYRRTRCVRRDHAYPHELAVQSADFQKLYDAYAGQHCAKGRVGWICPHKQFKLGSIQAEDGVITCPLHGMRIDAQTGVCLPRDGAKAP